MIDYRELLAKYMDQVIKREGVSFADKLDGPTHGLRFSDEEWAELQRIDAEYQSREEARDAVLRAECEQAGHQWVKQTGYLSEDIPYRCRHCGTIAVTVP